MPEVVEDGAQMVAEMNPILQPGLFVFVSAEFDPSDRVRASAVATVREAEGLSLLLPLDLAAESGFHCDQPMRQITLQVHSALTGVGLTAAVASALAALHSPCNMVAGFHHDHVFVPETQADAALDCLTRLQLQGIAK